MSADAPDSVVSQRCSSSVGVLEIDLKRTRQVVHGQEGVG